MNGMGLKVKSNEGEPLRPPHKGKRRAAKSLAKKAHGRQGEEQITNSTGVND
jgi:hypothetical protein